MMLKRAFLLMVAVLLLPGLAFAQTQTRATFEVNKNFTDENPNEVEVVISCNTGLPLEQSADIDEWDSVEFVVVNFDEEDLDCTVSESAFTGYTASYWAGGEGEGDADDDSDGCYFTEVESGDAFVCNIENEPDPVEVEVCKEWVYSNTTNNEISDSFKIDLHCSAEIDGGYETNDGWVAHWNSSGDDCETWDVYVEYGGDSCSVSEHIYDSAVESDTSDCGYLHIDIAEGNECTVVNTVFFEGIPTLNQYGLVLLALLMLGVGFVGFRRFA